MKVYDVALIGLGKIAWIGWGDPKIETHLATIKAHPRLKLTQGIDSDPQACAKFTGVTNLASQTKLTEEIEIAVVCTPPETHLEVVDEAIQAGAIGILCEKPLADTHESALAIRKACDMRGIPLVVGHQRRYDEGHREFLSFVHKGLLGKPIKACCHFTGSYLQNGTHAVDILRYMFNGEPIEWIISREPGPDEFSIEIKCQHGRCALDSYGKLVSGYMRNMYDDLLRCIEFPGPETVPICSGHDGAEAVRIALEEEAKCQESACQDIA